MLLISTLSEPSGQGALAETPSPSWVWMTSAFRLIITVVWPLLIICNYIPPLWLLCRIPLEQPLVQELPWNSHILGLVFGAWFGSWVERSHFWDWPLLSTAALLCSNSPAPCPPAQLLVLALCWVFLRFIHPQKSPQTDTYAAPGRGQQLGYWEWLCPALFICLLVKPSSRDQENLREQLSPAVGEQRARSGPWVSNRQATDGTDLHLQMTLMQN